MYIGHLLKKQSSQKRHNIGDRLSVSKLHLLDIFPPDASKGHGVAKLAEIHGLTAETLRSETNFNDLEMLEYAGTAVVMGNAAPPVA